MSTPPEVEPGLRARKKAQTRRTIQEHALRLFLEKGYEKTTVDEISAAAGVSHMTFFRYFPTKEAVVESDEYDPFIVSLIARRPAAEDSLTALQGALAEGLAQVYEADRDALLLRTRLILTTPALRSRLWANQDATQQLFVEALRLRHPAESLLATKVLAAAAVAVLTTALAEWAEACAAQDLPDLVDTAFATLRQ